MKRIWNFIITNRQAIIWTFFYILTTWAILYFMFHFNIFNGAQWHKLAHAQLRGFPGFVFGILILAMVPLYIASTTLIIRNKKPLINIPLPKITIGPSKNETSETTTDAPATITAVTPQIPSDVPDEIRPHFTRAIRNAGLYTAYIPKTPVNPASDATDSEPVTPPVPVSEQPDTTDDFPLPTDFDISLDDSFPEIPVFADINFDSTPDTPLSPSATPNQEIIQHLNTTGREFTTDGEVILTDKFAIIAHIDNDFWVTDPDNWFATGKTKPSPINAVTTVATEHNVTPVLYLGAQNILDLETLIPEWESNGIKVITEISEI